MITTSTFQIPAGQPDAGVWCWGLKCDTCHEGEGDGGYRTRAQAQEAADKGAADHRLYHQTRGR